MSEKDIRPVRCVLEPVPTTKQLIGRAALLLVCVVYVIVINLLAFGYVLNYISAWKHKSEIQMNIDSDFYLVKKLGKKK